MTKHDSVRATLVRRDTSISQTTRLLRYMVNKHYNILEIIFMSVVQPVIKCHEVSHLIAFLQSLNSCSDFREQSVNQLICQITGICGSQSLCTLRKSLNLLSLSLLHASKANCKLHNDMLNMLLLYVFNVFIKIYKKASIR